LDKENHKALGRVPARARERVVSQTVSLEIVGAGRGSEGRFSLDVKTEILSKGSRRGKKGGPAQTRTS
jgi:hypothetical protein